MKKILYLSVIATTVFIVSCKKQLDQTPISNATTETFYASLSDFIQGSNAIYNDLRGYPDRLMSLSEIRSDNIYGVSSLGVRDWDPINNFQKSITGNTYVEEAWSTDFNGVFRANTLLEQLDKNGAVITDANLRTRIQAEARFLRAFYYFDMVRYYGKLPIIEKTVSANEAIGIARSPVNDVYKFIIADLQFAITNLPPSYTNAGDIGRATKYAAEAVLAQVYMARSGPTYGIEGPGLASNEWNLALPLLNDIITKGGFVFNPDYANIFSYNNQSPAVNKEAIFDIMYLSGQTPVLGATYVWALAPNTYLQFAGDRNSSGSLEIIPVSNDLVNSYEANDKRKAFTIFLNGYTFQGNPEPRPFFKKWLDVTKIPSASRFDWGMNFIAIRYTDVLLLKAECILMGGGGSQGEADAIINQVRTRAGLNSVSNVTIDQLYDERRRELAGEGQRWFDLQRSGKLVTRMNAWIAAEDTRKLMNQVAPGFVIYPVPQSQLDAAPGLYNQNIGY
jgi:hypothetical protein